MALASSVRLDIAGQKVPDFLYLNINQQTDGLQSFEVACRMDTFEDADDFVISKSKKFIGSTMIIEIDAVNSGGDGSLPGVFFKGIIHSVKAVKSDLSNEDQILIIGYSPEFLLNDHPGCRSFENKSLKQIVDEVLKPYPRDILNAKVNPNYSELIPYCVQYNENRLQFLRRLATRYGEWMFYNGKELIFGAPAANKEEIILGKDLHTLDYSLNLKATVFKYVSYDYISGNRLETGGDQSLSKNQQNEAGKYAFDQSGKRFSQEVIQNYPHINVASSGYNKEQKNVADNEASAIALKMSGIEATGENLNLVPGSKIVIKALKIESKGEVNYGEYLITSINHHCNNLLNYGNSFTAISSEAKVPLYTDPLAIAFCDPQSAIVKDNKDPEKLGRVRVNFFWQDSNSLSPWLRIISPYSANERGFYFIPEIEDEVLVGFESRNAEKPYVIGSLYHGKNRPHKAWPNNKNSFKGIVTKNNLRIEFDDDKKITTIDTPAGNKVVISDDEKSILLSDQNQNTVELKQDGIILNSLKDIKLSSKSKILIEGTAGIEISSVADLKLSGLNINQEANVSFSAKGNATAELKASGQTTIQGAMVMIN